jgi:ribonuclease VapC
VIDAERDPIVSRELDVVRRELGIAIAPVTATHVDIARQAYRDFGRGSGHPAKLNFGDCFAYALAIEQDEPLLFIGNDFSHTDVEPALELPSS